MNIFRPKEYTVIRVSTEFDIIIHNTRILKKLCEAIHMNMSYDPNREYKVINLLSRDIVSGKFNHEFTIKLNTDDGDADRTIYEFLNKYILVTYHMLGLDIIYPSNEDVEMKVDFVAATHDSSFDSKNIYGIINDKIFLKEVDMDNFCWDLRKKLMDLTLVGEMYTPEHINDNTQTFIYRDMYDGRHNVMYTIKPKDSSGRLISMNNDIWFAYVNTIIDYVESNTKYV